MWIKYLGGLKLTIPLLSMTVISVAAATFIEGQSGSHTVAEGWIYRHPLFLFLLFLYFVNILFATFTRWPFKAKHIPFLTAHLGLLMLISGVALKGLVGLQGVMRLHEGEGSHLALLREHLGLFGRQDDCRFCFQITPGVSFYNGNIKFTPVEIYPHGEKRWEGWIFDGRLMVHGLPNVEISTWEGREKPLIRELADFDLSVLETEEPLLSLLPWKGAKPWLLFLQNREKIISIYFLHPDGLEQKIFDPKAPGEIVIYDGGKGGYGVEMGPFSSPLLLQAEPIAPPLKPEDARPILRLRGEKKGEIVERLLPFDPDGGGLPLPFFDTLVKFQPLVIKIPHHLHLHQAKTLYRPGTTIPEAYEAKITVDGLPFTLKMNEVYESPLGYRFYLSNIHGNPGSVKEVHLAVNYDPAKYILTYPGGLLIVFGALLLFVQKKSKPLYS